MVAQHLVVIQKVFVEQMSKDYKVADFNSFNQGTSGAWVRGALSEGCKTGEEHTNPQFLTAEANVNLIVQLFPAYQLTCKAFFCLVLSLTTHWKDSSLC